MKTLNTISFALAATLSAAPAAAQTLDCTIDADPMAGTAIYDFHLSGQPSAQAYLFASLGQGDPWSIHGISGALLIDATLLVPIDTVQLDPTGNGDLPFSAPWSAANGLPLFAQAVMLDPSQQIAFTNFNCAMAAQVQVAGGLAASIIAQYNSTTGKYRLSVHDAPANCSFKLLVNGGQKATGTGMTDNNGNGNLEVAVPGGIQRGDTV